MPFIIFLGIVIWFICKYSDYVLFAVFSGVIITIIYYVIKVNANKTNVKELKYKDFDYMNGVEFEQYCAILLRKNGFTNVKLTSATGDHGVDIIANKNGYKYVFQCKRYQNKVGNKAVQEAYSGKGIFGADIAVVITNSYFTPQAINDAKKLNVQLWDRNQITRMQ